MRMADLLPPPGGGMAGGFLFFDGSRSFRRRIGLQDFGQLCIKIARQALQRAQLPEREQLPAESGLLTADQTQWPG